MKNIRLVLLISGSGTTLGNFLKYKDAGELSADIVGVISSLKKCKKNTPIFDECEKRKIPIKIIRPRDFANDENFFAAQTAQIDEFEPDLILLAGYLKFYLIPKKYFGKVINIHPALLPQFGGKGFFGMSVHKAIITGKAKESGCTVHFANNKYDSGPIILQKKVPVLPDDTPETLQKRVFEKECEAYPEAVNLFAAGRLKIVGNIHETSNVEILPDC